MIAIPSELEIDLEYIKKIKETKIQFDAEIINVEEIAVDTFRVDISVGKDFTFKAGQYIWVRLQSLISPDPKGEIRAFSICSSEKHEGKISIAFRNSGSGYKKTLIKSKKGTKLKISNARGFFTIDEVPTSPIVMIAGGIGLTPYISLIDKLTRQNLTHNVYLITLNYREERKAFVKELDQLQKGNKNIKIHHLVTEGFKEEFIKQLVKEDLKDIKWYVSSSQELVSMLGEYFTDKGINKNNYTFDEFHLKNLANERISRDIYIEEMGSVFKLAVESSSNHIVITDTDGAIVYANKSAQTVTGYSFEEMKGNTPRMWGGLMTLDQYQTLWHTIKTRKLSFSGEFINVRKNGELYNAVARISPILDKENRLIGFIGTEEDITDSRKLEEKLVQKIRDYERLNKIMVDRELKMIELKKTLGLKE
jgi:PAS domain S-box-containing protein